jgi:hypothetical protein
MSRLQSERGVGIPELLVTIFAGSIVLIAVFSLIQITGRSSAQVAARVDANQRSRPVMERIMDELHSSCLSRDTIPVFAGSSDSSLSFIHQTGSSPVLNPVKRTISIPPGGGTLSESVYLRSGGTTPTTWTFSSGVDSTTQLLTKVEPAVIGDPQAEVPFFRYYAYTNGVLNQTPLPTPLSAADAARTVQVSVAFAASPLSNPTAEDRAAVSVASSAVLRFSPPSADTTKVNGPCN